MIEGVNIVAKEMVKVVAKSVEKAAAETGKHIAKETVDITRRVDISAKLVDSTKTGIDVTKRIAPDKTVFDGGKELTTKQKNELVKKGFSKGLVDDCTIKDGVVKVKTQNEALAGTKHPDTGVEYARKTVDLKGTKIEGVFPKFDSVFTTKLPENLFLAKDKDQFKYCTNKLMDAVNKNADLKNKFSPNQLEQIAKGRTPDGYVWNHNEVPGKMELVKSDVHAASNHTGGKAIWGGGKEFR